MTEFFVLAWAVWLLLSANLVTAMAHQSALTSLFPEGRRWWHAPAQYAALVIFAAAVLCNPWSHP